MEQIVEPKNPNETSAGSLGLGAALAVAYDITEDTNFSHQSYVRQEINSLPMNNASQSGGVIVFTKNGCHVPGSSQAQPVRYHAGDPYWVVSGCPQIIQHPSQQTIGSMGVPMTAYLNPIPVSSPHTVRVAENGSFFLQTVSQHQRTAESAGYLDVGPASESTLSTDSMISVRSDTVANYQQAEMGYTIKPIPQSSNLRNSPHHIVNSNGATTTVNSRRHDDQRQAAVPSTGSDDGLYELSEEDVKEIDDMLTQNPQVTSSRHWKYYVETNEWTRATCALMACLFSRDQMANSTVLGRGGSQRERLPTNLVAYVVTKMRRRFNRSAAAVRARMAQKCKDERRFGRVLPSGLIATNTDRSQPAAASTASRQSGLSRRRSAASASVGSGPKSQRLSGAMSLPPPPPPPPPPASSAGSISHSQECYLASPVHSTANPSVHDPPVILASAPEMAR